MTVRAILFWRVHVSLCDHVGGGMDMTCGSQGCVRYQCICEKLRHHHLDLGCERYDALNQPANT